MPLWAAHIFKPPVLPEVIDSGIEKLRSDFQNKLMIDEKKNEIIDRQHAELQELRNGIKNELLRPVIMDSRQAT